MKKLTAAICSYNRANRLPPLIAALREQACPVPFEILIVDNNSTDNTKEVLISLSADVGAPLRIVKETRQGIAFARNRAIEASLSSDFLLFMDDDELPRPGLLAAAVHALDKEGAQCTGGRIKVNFDNNTRPKWLGNDLLGFLAEVDYGDQAFWITDTSMPVWTANVAYHTSIFIKDAQLRFDPRYNRAGMGIGGGEDAIMFRDLLKRKVRIRYRPDMVVEHYVEQWRLKRRYFLKLHFIAGRKYGLYETGDYPHTFLGIPPFMFPQTLRQFGKAGLMYFKHESGALRQGMNASYALGCLWGRFLRWRDRHAED